MGTPVLLALAIFATIVGLTGSSGTATAQQGSLDAEFEAAANEYGVPKDLLKAMGYVNTRWEMPPPTASDYEEGGPKEGSPEARGNYGIMSLYQNPSTNTLGKAAELTGLSEEELKTDRAANIRGGAAVLADMQGEQRPTELNGWFDAVSDYGGGPVYANQVYETLQKGASAEISTGETVTLEPHPEAETQPVVSAQGNADYGRAKWYGAYHNGGTDPYCTDQINYCKRNRGAKQINRVVVHVTQGSFSSAINWFNDSRAGTSAHYTVRSSDGFVGQSVHEKDIAYHAGNWNYNASSIGIEHEGYVSNSSWFTTSMYRSSARLTAYLSKKYGIPIDRQHIIGHNEVPGATHTDPGPYWNWDRYMKLVKHYRGQFSGSGSDSTTYKQVVDNASSRFRATSDWSTNTWNSQKAGKDYRAIRPSSGKGSAKFIMKFPARDNYDIYAWWPAASTYNNRTRYLIRTTSGWKVKIVNQRKNGGRWVRLGTYNMAAGDGSFVRVAKRSGGTGYIIADAVLIKRR
jgi:hypothetical protein